MNSANIKKKTQPEKTESSDRVRRVLFEMIEACPDPSRLLELYYWSSESELLEMLHHYIGLPEQPREALNAFFAMAAERPDSVAVSVSPNGDVTLSSPEVARLIDRMDVVRTNDNQSDGRH